jgi:hypothetical protein
MEDKYFALVYKASNKVVNVVDVTYLDRGHLEENYILAPITKEMCDDFLNKGVRYDYKNGKLVTRN